MKFLIFGAIALVLAVSVVYDMLFVSPPVSENQLAQNETALSGSEKGRQAPDISFSTLDGTTLNLRKLSGKVVLLNFWASWCPPCLEEFPLFLKLLKEFKGEVVLVAVSNDEKEESIYSFLREFEKEYKKELKSPNIHIVWDKDKYITDDIFNTAQFPETIIISKNSQMVRKVVGNSKWDGPDIKEFLHGLVAAK
ncbi:MAG: TlpA family protein disulfide reductase [Nitrospinota bacterium]